VEASDSDDISYHDIVLIKAVDRFIVEATNYFIHGIGSKE